MHTLRSPAESAGVVGHGATPVSSAASPEATLPPPAPAARRGWLRHGNTPGDPNAAPRCGARTRAGGSCRAPAMSNGRCRMHGGASTGARTILGRALCGHARRKHPAWLAAGPAERSAANRTTRIASAMTRYARAWPNPWRRPLALRSLLRKIGRLLPDRIEECFEAAARLTMPYVRGEVDDVLRWLGKACLAADERPDSARVIAVLDGAVEAFGIAGQLDAPRRRRERRRLAQRARRAARAAQRGLPVKPSLPTGAQAPLAPREAALGRTADVQSASLPGADAVTSRPIRSQLRRDRAGGRTAVKPPLARRAEAPHAPRAPRTMPASDRATRPLRARLLAGGSASVLAAVARHSVDTRSSLTLTGTARAGHRRRAPIEAGERHAAAARDACAIIRARRREASGSGRRKSSPCTATRFASGPGLARAPPLRESRGGRAVAVPAAA
jgi:hypothetical protein